MKAQIGFLPEQPYFYDHLTAQELLHYYGQLSGVDPKQLSRRVESVLEQVKLSNSGNVQLRKFSKGMLQRVGIAQAILHDPKVVFLDEPMSGLDPMGRREVRGLIEDLKARGKTVFFSTHILLTPRPCATGSESFTRVNCGELVRLRNSQPGSMARWKSYGRARQSLWAFGAWERNAALPVRPRG